MSFEGEAPENKTWLAAVLGNTHVRWGWFRGQKLLKVECFPAEQELTWPEDVEVWLAPVGRGFPPAGQVRVLQLQDIPLGNLYPSLGVDRALALWAGGIQYGWPCLVIDAGTALTLTGGDEKGSLVGGAILPGLGLQARSLHTQTARLPQVDWHPHLSLPCRWARETSAAIYSGIAYTLLAGLQEFIADWRRRFPQGSVLLTGGDGQWLYAQLQQRQGDPDLHWDPHLVLRGIAHCRQLHLLNSAS